MKALPYIVAAATATACGVVLYQFNKSHQIIGNPENAPAPIETAAQQHSPSLPTIASPPRIGTASELADSADRQPASAIQKDASKSTRRAPALANSRATVEIVSVTESLRTTRDPIQKRRLFIELIEGLTPENAAEMREAILKLPHNSPEFKDFHFALGQMLGEEAVIQAADTKELDMADSLRGWASSDPNAAYDWFAERFADGKMTFHGGGVGQALITSLATTDLDLATETAVGAGAESKRAQQSALWSLASTVARNEGIDQAANWAETVPEGDSRNAAVMSVARIWASRDAEQAFDWAVNISDEKLRETTLIQVGRQFVRSNPDEAKRRLSEAGIPETALRYSSKKNYKKR